ncbi:MAG: DUF2330 domain-containing protein [Polyangia bacterium]
MPLSRPHRPLAPGRSVRAVRTRRRVGPAALLLGSVLSLGAPLLVPAPARACGCFAPPDVATPIVQAGEKIVFVNRNGVLEMHVQIQYSGKPADFGWILPLPAVPKNRLGATGIDVGSVELFDQLETVTQPTYVLQRNPCIQRSSGPALGCGAFASDSLAGSDIGNQAGSVSPLVTQDSVGPYEFAVLKADSKTEMLNWLNMNRYVVPAGTDGALAPYIRPGAYFLALKLKAGRSAGDVQPVVLRFPADLPTVPITLTAVGATPNMGVLIWVLGGARAIPRNYFHTVVNDAQIDWLDDARNYSEVVRKAVAEAQGKHAFVTEFAGSSRRMSDVLDGAGRYSVLNTVSSVTDPVSFVRQILPVTEQRSLDDSVGFQPRTFPVVIRGFALNGQLYAVLGRHIPMPQALVATGVAPADYYQRIDYYLNQDRRANPGRYADIETALASFKPAAAAQELKDLIATPTLDAGQLFQDVTLSKLTRMFTVLSPEDMNLDPAFSFNRELPDVSNIHNATLSAACPDQDREFAELLTGTFTRRLTADESSKDQLQPLPAPYSQRIEQLADTGSPAVKTDNTEAIKGTLAEASKALGGGGCTATERRRPSGSGPLALLGGVVAAVLLRRRRPQRA